MAKLGWGEALPIVRRELRVASRRRVTFRLRFISAIVGAAIFLAMASVLPGTSAEHGWAAFWASSMLAAVVCALSGLALTLESLIREKREGTLGLLFLTRLSGLDIVLGKLAAAGLSAGGVAFAMLPFLAVSMCFGGVTATQFWMMAGALLLLLAYSLALGIFLSALFRRESIAGVFFLLALFGPLALHAVIFLRPGVISNGWQALNPLLAVMALLEMGGVGGPNPFNRGQFGALAALYQASAIISMVIAAAVILPWTVKSAGAPTSNPFRRRLRALKPLAWLWICLGAWFGIWALGLVPRQAEMTYAFALVFLPKFFVAWQASSLMAEERQAGGLEILLTTPMTTHQALMAKAREARKQFAPALIFVLAAQWLAGTRWWAQDKLIPIETTWLFAMMISLLIDVYAITWVGLWQGLLARNRGRALLATVLLGLGLPWSVTMLFGLLTYVVFEPLWMREPQNFFLIAYPAVTALTVGMACLAMGRLHDTLRQRAADSLGRRGASGAISAAA